MLKITVSILTLILFTISYSNIVLAASDENVVVLFTFDEDTIKFDGNDPAEVEDLSGNENTGLVNGKGGEVVSGVNPPEIVEGKFGDAIRFDGTNWVEVVDSPSTQLTDGLTLEAWVKPETSAGDQTVVTKDRGYYLQVSNGQMRNYGYGWDQPGYHVGENIPIEEWSHLVVTWDGSKIVHYVNAKETLTVSTGGEIEVTDDSIGIGAEVRIPSRGDANWRFYTGAIDNVRVLNVAITASEVRDSMENGIFSVEAQDKLAVRWATLKIAGE